MTSRTIKITQKGQVTIPKEIRAKLCADTIYFEIRDGDILVKPVRDVAGSLRGYAQNVKPGTSMRKLKDEAWQEAVRDKWSKKSS